MLTAVEGWGKTSLSAYTENPALILAKGETGYQTLLGAGRVPSVDTVTVDTWPELLAVIPTASHKTVVLDALDGFEQMCQQHICNSEFGGDWGERGFASYAKGYDLAATEWIKLLSALEKLQANGTDVLLLAHSRIENFASPTSGDYSRYIADLHKKVWQITARWVHAILFGTFIEDVISKERKQDVLKKGKGIGGKQRILYTERCDAWDAKNQYGMSEQIIMPNDPSQVWNTIYKEITKNRKD